MIEITNVCKTYDTGNKALRNINISIEDGEFVFIIGRSGSGKSTLLKMLLKEVEPTSGKIVVNDMLLADEPTGNLDHDNAIEIMRLLDLINQKGTTVIVVTHSNELVNMMQKRVITMDRGCIISDEEGGFIHED